MPQLRSFGAYAPKPDLAGAALGAASLVQRGQIAAQQNQLAREKIAADMAQSNMELQAKQQALQSQALRDDQELKIKQQYQQTMLSMQERELSQKQEVIQRQTQEAARTFAAQQQMQNEYVSGGATPESFRGAAMKYGPMAKLPGSVYSQAMTPEKDTSEIGKFKPVEGMDPKKFGQFVSGFGSRELVKLPENLETGGPAPAGYTRVGTRIIPEREPVEIQNKRKDLSRLERRLEGESFKTARMIASAVEANPDKKLQPAQKSMLDSYRKAQKEADDLRQELKAGPVKRVTSKEEYDALDVGDIYLDADGKKHKKTKQ